MRRKKFDLITMFHCFEHLPRPLEFLIKIKSFLKENGKIIIEVPHARDFFIEKFKGAKTLKNLHYGLNI